VIQGSTGHHARSRVTPCGATDAACPIYGDPPTPLRYPNGGGTDSRRLGFPQGMRSSTRPKALRTLARQDATPGLNSTCCDEIWLAWSCRCPLPDSRGSVSAPLQSRLGFRFLTGAARFPLPHGRGSVFPSLQWRHYDAIAVRLASRLASSWSNALAKAATPASRSWSVTASMSTPASATLASRARA
jgi:hypothetical protein